MGEMINLFDRLVDMANSQGEEFNDGDEWPGWLAAEWVETDVLEVTYTNPEKGELVRRYRVTEDEG